MFPNLFSSSPIVWASLLGLMIALPLLIHLINLLRHRRVKWAAMDFLLQSYKRQRNWIRLKQLILLLARIAALVLALLMLAQVGCDNDRLSGMLGGRTVHHYVLVDDSYSMTAQTSGRSALQRAREALEVLGQRLSRGADRRVTLLKFSSALPLDQADDNGLSLEQLTDLNGVRVDSRFGEVWEESVGPLAATPLALAPQDALAFVRQLIEERTEEDAVVHVFSDFRTKDWGSESTSAESSGMGRALAQEIAALNAAGAKVDLIRCEPESQPNLAVSRLEALGNIRAAGVPVQMRVAVTNYSDQPSRNVTVRVFSRPYSEDSAMRGDSTQSLPASELPTVFFDEIGAGETVVREFPVFFSLPGRHEVRCLLPDDSVAQDNQRWAVLETRLGTQALIVDGSGDSGAFYLSTIFRPGRAQSGVIPTLKSPDALRELSVADLAQFDVVYVLGVSRLEQAVISKLESYVSDGGGVAWFVDPQTDLEYFNSTMYRAGEGLFGIELERIETTPTFNDGELPDVVPTEHPLLAPFRNRNDSLLSLVQVSRYATPPLTWSPEDEGDVEVAAQLRGDRRSPLLVFKRFGQGRSLVMTTSVGQAWNNWQRNPTFPVLILGMHEFLSAGRHENREWLVGQSVQVALDSEDYRPEATIELPTEDPEVGVTLEREARTTGEAVDSLVMGVGPGFSGAIDVHETWVPGLYTLWARRSSGDWSSFRWALNVDPSEGDLQTVTDRQLAGDYAGEGVSVMDWDDLSPNPEKASGALVGRWLLPILILLLIGEQLLAYAISYHPGRGAKLLSGGTR